jgi:hypothetical protein
MARSPVISATLALKSDIAKELKAVSAEIIKVSKDGNVSAEQLETVFATAARKIADGIGRTGEMIENDFRRIETASTRAGNAIGQTGRRLRQLGEDGKAAGGHMSALKKTLDGMAAMGVIKIGTAIGHGVDAGIDTAHEYVNAEAKLIAAGVKEDDRKQIVAQAQDLNREHPSVPQAAMLEGAIGLHNILNADERKDGLSLFAQTFASLKRSGIDTSNLAGMFGAAENLGIQKLESSVDPKTGIRTEGLREFIRDQLKAMQASEGLIDPKELKDFVRNAKSAGLNMSPEFRAAIMPSLVQEMGGPRAGASVATFFSTLVQGHLSTQGAKALAAMGVFKDSDIQYDKIGQIKGVKKGAEFVDEALFKENQFQWVRQLQQRMLAKGMTEDAFENSLARALPQRAADVALKYARQGDIFEKRGNNFRNAEGFDILKEKTASGEIQDAEGRKDNALMQSSLEGLKSMAKAADGGSKSLDGFSRWLQQIARTNPALASAMSLGQIGGGKVLEGALQAGGLMAMFGGAGFLRKMLPVWLGGAARTAATTAAADTAPAALAAEAAAPATLAAAEAAAPAALATAGGGTALVAGEGAAVAAGPPGWIIGALVAAGVGLTLMGKKDAENKRRQAALVDRLNKAPGQLSSMELEEVSLGLHKTADRPLEQVQHRDKGPFESEAAFARRLEFERGKIVEMNMPVVTARAELARVQGEISSRKTGPTRVAPAPQPLAPPPPVQVRGSVESMQTVKLELSPEAHKLLAQPSPVVAKVPIMLGSNPIDRPRTSPR